MTEPFYRSTQQGLQILQQQLSGWARIQWLEQTDSSNAQLLLDAKSARQHTDWPRLLGTEFQTQGRGRAGRSWINKPGGALMFSCGFLLELPAQQLVGMAPALGIVACQALRNLAGPQATRLRMKWPNDIMLDDCKLAGILVESRIMGKQVLIVAGMGLNLTHAHDIGSQLGRHLGEWSALEGAEHNKFVLAAQVAQSWQACLNQYNQSRLQSLTQQAQAFDYLAGQKVHVLQNGQVQQSGLCLGLGPDGALRIQDEESGQVQSVHVGDISVRPINNLSL